MPPPIPRFIGSGAGRSTGLVAPLTALLIAGCAPRTTHFFISDHRDGQPEQRYYEEFEACYFREDADGNVDIVARHRTSPDDPPGPRLTQVIHIRRVWAAVPGQTFAERSMINATVCYLILDERSGATFEGGGFITFRRRRGGEEIAGRLESSSLVPVRRVGPGGDLFQRATVTGSFVARQNKREVVRVLNEMDRLLGPMPAYDPPPVNPRLR